MGACYSVILVAKTKNEKSATECLKAFVANGKANFHTDEFARAGVDTGSFDGLVRVILAGYPETQYVKKERPDGFTVYGNDFGASYGWQGVLIDFFNALAPHLEDGSGIVSEPDEGCDEAVVENGKAIWN